MKSYCRSVIIFLNITLNKKKVNFNNFDIVMASRNNKVRKSDSFVVREISGKGMSVIAIRDINPGELLIAEEPLFVIPWWIRHSIYPR